ncbi:hypothetical protein ACMFMG_007160 [Clarireedia jacksonii]
MSSESTLTPTAFAETTSVPSADEKTRQTHHAESDRAKTDRSTPSTPDSMKAEFGSEVALESEATHSERSSSQGNSGTAEDLKSDGSWEEIKHELVDGKAQGDDKKQKVREDSSDGIAPEFLPRTPRPYGSHGL